MADLVTRLILDNKQFNDNIARSKQQTQQFENVTGKITGAIGKFAAGIGIAMGATEAFNKVIHSSQTLSDAWDNTINACKGTVDAFFQSLSTGNFDAFNNGILSTIKNMRELSALRDSLADAKLSMSFNTRVFERDFSRLEGIIDDTTKSKTEREAAYKELQSLIANFNRDVNDTQKGTETTLLKSLSARFGRNDFTLEDINKYIAINNNDFSTREEKKALQDYQKKLQELKKKQYYATTIGGGIMGGSTMMVEDKNVTKQIELFKAQNAELEKQNILNNDNDEARKQMIEDYEYALELQQKGYDYQKRSLEKQNTISSLNNSSNSKKDSIVPVGSVAELDKLISEAKKKYNNAITDAARVEALKLIKELEQRKVVLNITAKFNSRDLEDLELSPMKTDKFDTSKIKLEKLDTIKFKPIISKEDVNTTNEYVEALNAISSTMGAVSTMTDKSATAWVTWSANLLTAIAAAIPAISSLIAAKKTEAIANGVASATETPIIGWLLAGAAVASVAAAIASMPKQSKEKFAHGGIVGGHSFAGDRVPILANSGEMVLNKQQQANLFNLLDKGATLNNSIAGEVEFVIHGNTLRGLLQQQNNRLNRLL